MSKKLIKYYFPYWMWEDWINGYYKTEKIQNDEVLIKECAEILKSKELFYELGVEVIKQWPYCSNQNLSNTSINRRSWLGAVCCLYLLGAPEYITRLAWKQLTEQEKNNANLVAEKIINEYERQNKTIH